MDAKLVVAILAILILLFMTYQEMTSLSYNTVNATSKGTRSVGTSLTR